MDERALVPADFDVPRELRTDSFRLEPLGPEHNAADLVAWMSSIPHIQTSPGFANHGWPPDEGLSAEANLGDLIRHAEEFERRVAFAYTVLRSADGDAYDVLGCVYLDPGDRPGCVDVRSWVRADVAELDVVLRQTVRDWLAHRWPFDEVVYAG